MPGARRSVATARRPVFATVQAFTGLANGAAWPGYTTVAGTVDVQNEKGRTQTTADAYAVAGAYKIAANPFNFELTANATITTVTATEFYGIINVRASTNTFTDVRQHSSWNLRFYGGTGVGLCELYRVDAAGVYSAVLGAGSDIDFVQGSVLRVRVRCEGFNIKVRYWKDAETEPSPWQIDYTDATPATGTGMSLLIRNGNDLAADSWSWDDITVTTIGASPNPSGTVVRTLSNATAAISGTFGSSSFPPPVASAIAGMSSTPYRDYDWTSDTVNPTGGGDNFHGSFNGSVSDWVIVNWADVQNNEKSAPRTTNVTVENDATASGGKMLRLAVRQESWIGFAYSGVQMENFYSGPAPGAGAGSWRGYGQGSPFFVECRLRWTGYDGFWAGPWMYDLTSAAEVDIMETVNNAAARYAFHSPNAGPTSYIGAGTPDGQWHRYGLRFDFSTVGVYYDNVLVQTLGSSLGTAFANANMGLKLQHFCGGSYPDGEAGHTTPLGVTFPKYFDVDWVRIYR